MLVPQTDAVRRFEHEVIMHDLSRRNYQRILIIKPSSFGDVIHALPVLNGLRSRFPDAKISWLVSTSCAGLLEGHPALDEVIPFDRKRYGRIGRSVRITADFLEFVHALRARKFDLVLDLQGLFRSGFLTLASGAPTRVGFDSARELAWIFYTHRVPVPDQEMHATDRYYLFARPLGFDLVPIAFHLPVHAFARAAVEATLARQGIAPGEPYALMAPGTRWETKRWPAEHFAAVARRLRSEHGLPIVLTGMTDESGVARQVAESAGGGIVSLAGRTKLAEMIALVAGATIVVMHDSGPMHLAAALNKPMVAIYGPTSPRRTGPYRRPETIARVNVPCSPCRIKRVADCPYGHRCMKDLSPDAVSAKVTQALSAGVPSP